jgi:hypothetical protein
MNSILRFGEKIALHKTPDPRKSRNTMDPDPLTRPDASETARIMGDLFGDEPELMDVVVLSSQKKALIEAGIQDDLILERTPQNADDQPDVFLTEEDVERVRRHYKRLAKGKPEQARQYADGVAESATVKIYQETRPAGREQPSIAGFGRAAVNLVDRDD